MVCQLIIRYTILSSRRMAHSLVYIDVSTARTSDTNTNVVASEELAGQLTTLLVECCGKHHVTVVRILVHILVGQHHN